MNWYKRSEKEYEKLQEGEIYWPSTFSFGNKEMSDEEFKKWEGASRKHWLPVESSFITHVGYNESLNIFEIKMKGGKEYSFFDVPKRVFDDFMKSDSKGKFFNEIIRKKYKTKKIDVED